jgi:hypothetical protein
VNLKDYLPDSIKKEEGAPSLRYVFKDDQGKTYATGILDESLTTQRIFTNENEKMNLYVLGGQWTTSFEAVHPTDESSDSADSDHSTPSGKGE